MRLKKCTNLYPTVRVMQGDRRMQIKMQTFFLRCWDGNSEKLNSFIPTAEDSIPAGRQGLGTGHGGGTTPGYTQTSLLPS